VVALPQSAGKDKCMRLLIPVFLCLFSMHAQEVTLQGRIIDVNNQPISLVNVMLLRANDSTFVKGTATAEDGVFFLEKVTPGTYIFQTSFIGFEPVQQELQLAGHLDMGDLALTESVSQMDEITLVSRMPVVRREIDRLVFQVENTSLSSGSTWEILHKTPGVIIQQNSITVQNQPVTVYINDRKVHLTSAELRGLLESYSGTNIKAIEVITKPSAKYEAESGIIINIVTSSHLIAGYKGSVSGTYTQAIFAKYRTGTSHFYKNDWLNAFVDYSYNPRKDHKNDLTEITFFEPNASVNSFWETDFERITRSNVHQINSSFDFDLGEKSNLNISSNLFLEPNTTFNSNELAEIYNAQRMLDSTFVTNSFLEEDRYNLAFDATYKQELGEKGSYLTIQTHYTNYDRRRNQFVNTQYFLPNGSQTQNNDFFTQADQKIEIYSGQIDLNTKIGSVKFETGLRTAIISSETNMLFFDGTTDNSQINFALSDNFFYDETVIAGYASVSKDWEKWKVRAGLRAENTDLEGISITMAQTNRQSYFQLFPTANVQYSANENHTIGAAYRRSIDRPRYNLLNPFRYFINENNFISGNPNLNPAITDRFSIDYVLKSKYSFEGYFRRSSNYIDVLSLQNNPNRFLQSLSVNLEEKMGYGVNFTYGNTLFDWWYFSTYTSFFHEENTFIAVESDNQLATISINGAFFQMYNGLTLSKDRSFSADVTFLYLSNFVTGSYIMDPYATLSIGLRKSLWSNRAVITLTANDLLNTTNRLLQSQYLNQDNSYFAILETQYLQFGFVYNFGNFKLRDNSKQIRNTERTRL